MQHQQQYPLTMAVEEPLATEATTKQLLAVTEAAVETMKELRNTMKHVEYRQNEGEEPESMEQRKTMGDTGISWGHQKRSEHEAGVEDAMFDAHVAIDERRYGYDHKVTIIIVIVCVVCVVSVVCIVCVVCVVVLSVLFVLSVLSVLSYCLCCLYCYCLYCRIVRVVCIVCVVVLSYCTCRVVLFVLSYCRVVCIV